jgi:2-amino-4-hydroxy-6-hydroxymethyldihydropteridine diphosphokinase
MILIGIGANLPSKIAGPPLATCQAAVERLHAGTENVTVTKHSPWYRSAPLPRSDQPRYINGVVLVETPLRPAPLLELLHRVEDEFGRYRSVPNAARVLDLDLLAYSDVISTERPMLPHPRLHERAFVVLPLADICPGWQHPILMETALQLSSHTFPGQITEKLTDI